MYLIIKTKLEVLSIASHASPSELKVSCKLCNPSFVILHVSSMRLPSPPKDDKVEVVSQQQDEKEEAPEELNSHQEDVTYEQPRDLLLEQTNYLTEPQALGFQQAQTPEALNGGSHQGDHNPSQKGVCGFLCVHTVCVRVQRECTSARNLFCMLLLCSVAGSKTLNEL